VSAPTNVLVVGGGISGLVCAWRLRQQRLPVILFEGSSRFGGVIGAVEKSGFLFDLGPQSFTATAPLRALIEELDLAGELLFADPGAPRYILFRGKLQPVRPSPPALLRSPLLGWRTRLRLLTEPLRHASPPQDDESIAAFVRRKFGEDLLANLVAPFVSGVFAGDPEKLSLRSAFPGVHALEEQYGSVLRGAMKSRPRVPREKGRESSLGNFRRGMVTLPQALVQKLGEAAQSGVEILALQRSAGENPSEGFELSYRQGGMLRQLRASAVVVATPTDQASNLLQQIDPRFPEAFAQIEYAGVAQVSAGYRMAQIAEPLASQERGFGFLVPRAEGLRLLGTVFSSFLFPGRAPTQPEQMASFTSFLGGATDPQLCQQTEDRIAEIARTELAKVLRIGGPPVVENVWRSQRALPQYNLGHQRVVAALRQLCAEISGLFLAGNYLSGPSLGSCIEQSNQTAEAVAGRIATRA